MACFIKSLKEQYTWCGRCVVIEPEATMSIAREEAKQLLDSIPDSATWDDIMYEFYVRKKVENAVEEADADDVVPHEEVERRLRPK
jgi:hypothetical protein